MKLKKYGYLSLLLFSILLINFRAFAADIPPRPNPPRLVNDFAGILNNSEIKSLEYQLRYFHDTTSNQIVIVTVKSLNGMAAADFATRLGYQWQVGQKKFDNGIVVLIKSKYGNSRGQAFIAVGYGLEGAIPDAIAKKIVENEMIPHFRKGDYFGGIQAATVVLMKLASGEISAKGYNKTHQGTSPFAALLPFVIFILIYLLIRASNARSYSVGKGTSFWTAFMLGSMLGGSGSSHSGSWNDFSGGSSGFGGGFGGFGGGSFGGGGAGGSW